MSARARNLVAKALQDQENADNIATRTGNKKRKTILSRNLSGGCQPKNVQSWLNSCESPAPSIADSERAAFEEIFKDILVPQHTEDVEPGAPNTISKSLVDYDLSSSASSSTQVDAGDRFSLQQGKESGTEEPAKNAPFLSGDVPLQQLQKSGSEASARTLSSPSTCDLWEDLDNPPVPAFDVIEDLNISNDEQVLDVSNPSSLGNKSISSSGSCSSRKRQSHPQQWIANTSKRALNRGEEHVNVKGKTVRAREMKPDCGEFCRFQCRTKIDEESRLKIFEQFWKLGDHTRQWDFLIKHIKLRAPKQPKPDATRSHTFSRYYFFPAKGAVVCVCQRMFLNTLDISERWVRTAVKKVGEGATVSPDKRGRNSKVNLKVSADVKDSVRQHIKMFPKVESHYTRARSKRQYLPEGLSIREMHRLYLSWMDETERTDSRKASERQYRDIFVNEFNLAFFQPKKDQCDLCSVYKSSTDGQKGELNERYKAHLANKDRARELKDLDKKDALSNPTVCFACFDLQKVLSTPKCESSVLYYKRKLSVYNFTVYDAGKHQAFCYVWNESSAKRGANEMASCLKKFIETQISNNGVTDFRFYSDNCAGQNKNKFLFSMYAHISAKYNVKITHRYLERGHTQNEGDSVHAVIERASKGKNIFVPDEWYTIIEQAKKTGLPYRVIPMEGFFLDFHPLGKSLQWAKDVEGKKVSWTTVREIITGGDSEGRVLIRTNLHQESCSIVSPKRAGKGRPLNLKFFRFDKAYTERVPIAPEKHADLISLCNALTIPEKYHSFYKTLTSSRTENDSRGDGDDHYASSTEEGLTDHFESDKE